MGKLVQFFNENLILFIILCAALVALIVIVIALVCILKNKKKNKETDKQILEAIETIVACLGGKENIISAEAKGSRLSVVLKDYSLIEEDKIKEQGVSSIIKMTTKVTLLVGSLSQEIANYINK